MRASEPTPTATFSDFRHQFMFWSPVVRAGLVGELIGDFELFINAQYKDAIDAFRSIARKSTSDTNNPQIVEYLRQG